MQLAGRTVIDEPIGKTPARVHRIVFQTRGKCCDQSDYRCAHPQAVAR
jgi:hypothetical protein